MLPNTTSPARGPGPVGVSAQAFHGSYQVSGRGEGCHHKYKIPTPTPRPSFTDPCPCPCHTTSPCARLTGDNKNILSHFSGPGPGAEGGAGGKSFTI